MCGCRIFGMLSCHAADFAIRESTMCAPSNCIQSSTPQLSTTQLIMLLSRRYRPYKERARERERARIHNVYLM